MTVKLARTAAIERAQQVQAGGKKDWYRIANKAGAGAAELYIYDEIGFWGVTGSDLVKDLKDVDGDLTVHISSPGGEVFDGLAIYQALKAHKGTVTVVIDSLAASIASVIAQAGDKLIMAPKAQYMIHDAFTVGVGNAADLRETADVLDRVSDTIASVYADKTGLSTEHWRAQMAKDTWFNADEALAAGLIDEVQGKEAPAQQEAHGLAASTFKHTSRDDAPAPVIKPEPVGAKHSLVKETPETPAPEVKDEAPAFTWDFSAFKEALKGVSNG